MHTLNGSFKIVAKETGVTFYINIFITAAIFALFIILNSISSSNDVGGVLFGPFYIVFLTLPFIFFKAYRFILGLGGTRTQFMFASYLSSLIFLTGAAIILTAFHFIGETIFRDNYTVFHMADVIAEPSLFMYFWIDFLWLFILFSIGMFAQVINFNLGTIRSLILVGLLVLISISAYFYIDFAPLLDFIFTDYTLFVHLLAAGSLILLVLSHFMMKNAPLERGDRKILKPSLAE